MNTTEQLAEALRCYVTGDEFNERTENQLYNQAREALRLFDAAKAEPLQEQTPLPEPHARVDGKLGTYCSFESTEARRGDAVYTADQMRDYARAALAATPAPVEPVAWQYTLEYGASIADRKVSLEQLRYPFGVCGADYLRVNSDGVSYVRETPLFAAPVAQAEPRKPLTESALCREVCEYGPQSEDEETGFRDGFRAAERVHGIGASTKESNK